MENLGELILQTLHQMQFLWKILLFSFLGIMVAEIIFKRFPNFTKMISKPAGPLIKLCHLPDEAGAIFLSSIFSSVSATNSALMSLRANDRINEKQIIVAAILNTTLTYLRRIIVFVMPVFVPLFGWKFFLGVLLCGVLVIAGKISFCVAYGKTISQMEKSPQREQRNAGAAAIGKANELSFKKPIKMFFKMARVLLITTFAIFLFINTGVLEQIAGPLLSPLIALLALPESFNVPVIVFFSGNIIAGAGVFKQLLLDGIISNREAFMGIIFGILVCQPAIAIRHMLPAYMSVFGKKLTFKIVGASLAIAITARTLAFFIFKIILL